MTHPHSIRLRGPWDVTVITDHAAAAVSSARSLSARRVVMPTSWAGMLGTAFRGRVKCERSFARPTGLELHERVWLVCEGVDARGQVTLNGVHLGSIDGYALPARFEITSLLAPRNACVIEVEVPPLDAAESRELRPGRTRAAGGLIGDVRLEITGPYALDDVVLQVVVNAHGVVQGRATWRLLAAEEAVIAEAIAGGMLEVVLRRGSNRYGTIVCETERGALSIIPRADETWPRWRPHVPCDLNGVEPLVLELRKGGEVVWQCSRPGVARERAPLPMDQASGELNASAAKPIIRVFPVDLTERSPAPVDLAPVDSSTAWPFSATIPAEPILDLCDRAGIPLIVAVPPHWQDRVAARLAAHPSVMTWNGDSTDADRRGMLSLPGLGGSADLASGIEVGLDWNS